VRTSAAPVLTCLREATGDLHRRLEARFDAVGELADPKRKPGAVARYKAFYASAVRPARRQTGLMTRMRRIRRDPRPRARSRRTSPPTTSRQLFRLRHKSCFTRGCRVGA